MAADREEAVGTLDPPHGGSAASGGRDGFLVLRGVTKRFGETVAVDHVDISIARGEFFALLGPSGCGKTTTMRCVAGFEEPSSGQIEINGRSVEGLAPARRDTGMVFQNYALFPHYDVFRNVAYGLLMDRLHGSGSARLGAVGSLLSGRVAHRQDEIREAVGQALAQVDLAGYEHRRISQLSGGQQQRVALARALVKRPSVLLMDEPLSNLDRKLRTQMRYTIRDIQQEVGITTIFVTHDQEEAMSMADRIALMRDGRIIQVSQPSELYERPVTPWAADFVGTSNLIAGRVSGSDGGRTTVTADGVTLDSDDEWNGADDRCQALIRPEALAVSRTAERRDRNRWIGRIRHVGYLGAAVQYEIETATGMLRVEQSFAGPSSLFNVDEDVALDVDASRVRLLAPEEQP